MSGKQVGSIKCYQSIKKHTDNFEQLHSLISGSFPKSRISHNIVYKLAVIFFFPNLSNSVYVRTKSGEGRDLLLFPISESAA